MCISVSQLVRTIGTAVFAGMAVFAGITVVICLRHLSIISSWQAMRAHYGEVDGKLYMPCMPVFGCILVYIYILICGHKASICSGIGGDTIHVGS